MKNKIEKLGKVSITVEKDYWDKNKPYNRLTIVERQGTRTAYLSRKVVPIGVDITDRNYWITISKWADIPYEIVQEFGDSPEVVISQKIVTLKLNELQKLIDDINEIIGDGGSVDERIAEEGARHYTKDETYNKTELNNIITTPNQQYVSVTATAQTTSATDVLPTTGAADTIYRVGNWDGNQYNDSVLCEYAWNGSAYIKLSTKSQIGEVYDISANHSNTKYTDLAEALSGDNVPVGVRRGGMSVKFVQSSDNKYVQYRLMANAFSTTVSDWQGVDDEPTAGSGNLVKSEGVSNSIGKLLGERNVSLIGNNSNWAVLPQAKRNIILKKNIQHTITLVSNEEIIVPSGVGENYRTMCIQVLSTISDKVLWSKEFNAPEHANNGDVFIVPPLKEDVYLYVEGRWNSTTTIDFIVNEDLFEYNIFPYDNIIADNINHKLQIPSFSIVKGGNSPKSIRGISIDYSSFPLIQTTDWAVCLKEDDTLEYKPHFNRKSGDIVLVSILLSSQEYINNLTSLYFNTIISDKNSHFFKDEYLHYKLLYSNILIERGKIEIINPSIEVREEQHVNINLLTEVSYPSDGFTINGNKLTIEYVGNGYPTLFYNLATQQVTAKNDYHYPPADGTLCLLKIDYDGLYYGILATQLISIKENKISDILSIAQVIAEKNVVKGSIWDGNLDPSIAECLSSNNYISVKGGSIIYTPHASDLTLRINQYNADKQVIGTSGQALYSDIQAFALDNNTAFIRIGASYLARGYNAQNPITVDAYQDGDFDVVLDESERLLTLEASNRELNERVNTVEDLTQSLKRNLYEDITKDGQGTTWLFYDFDVSSACSHTIEFLNSATNGNPAGVNYLIYGDNALIYNGTVGANIVAGTKNNIAYGYRNIRVECRVASGESLAIRCSQVSIPEEIDALKVKASDVIERNAYQEPAIRCAGKQSVDTDLKAFAFMHISDTHVKTGDANYYKCLENARKIMDYYTNLKCCIITGDIVYDTFADPMTPYDAALGYSDKLYLNVIGNHDAGQENQTVGYLASVGTDEQVYNKFIAPYKDKWDLGNGDTGKNYYYKDFTEEKVRLIILYDFETDFELNEAGTRLKYWREACTVRQAQVDWLINTLENTPSDYGVIVAHHINYKFDNSDNAFTTPRLRNAARPEYQYSSDKQWLEKILTAYQNKTTIDISWSQLGGVVTTLEANHDFSNAGGEFICILAGHTHDDFIGHPADFPNLVLLTVGSDNLHYTGSSCAREYNHLSEDLVNIVNIERNQKTITVVRVGANFSVTGQRRDSITLSYNIGNN